MKITVGSEETRLSDKACKCFSRNPAQVNDLDRVASSTCVWNKLVTECRKQIVGKHVHIFEIKHLIHSCSGMYRTYPTVHFYKYKRKQLRHCYDDRAKLLSHRNRVLLTINSVEKNS